MDVSRPRASTAVGGEVGEQLDAGFREGRLARELFRERFRSLPGAAESRARLGELHRGAVSEWPASVASSLSSAPG